MEPKISNQKEKLKPFSPKNSEIFKTESELKVFRKLNICIQYIVKSILAKSN